MSGAGRIPHTRPERIGRVGRGSAVGPRRRCLGRIGLLGGSRRGGGRGGGRMDWRRQSWRVGMGGVRDLDR